MVGKRIGLMTWYRYENSGTALQAVAFYTTIGRIGYAPDLIRYRPGYIVDLYRPMLLREIATEAIPKIRWGDPKPFGRSVGSRLFSSFIEVPTIEGSDANSFPRSPSARALEGGAASAKLRDVVTVGDAEGAFGDLLRERGLKIAIMRALLRRVLSAIRSVLGVWKNN